MASTILHDERPSTSSYVSGNSNPSTTPSSSARPSTMAAAIPPPFQYWQFPPSYTPRTAIGHWQPGGPSGVIASNGYHLPPLPGNGNIRAFNPHPIPLNWTQQPRNFLPQAPFYMQQPSPPIPWNTFGYSYTQPPPNIIHQQLHQHPPPPPPWTPSPQQQAQKSNNVPIERDQQQHHHHQLGHQQWQQQFHHHFNIGNFHQVIPQEMPLDIGSQEVLLELLLQMDIIFHLYLEMEIFEHLILIQFH
jgi:hypothetical protein